MPATRKHGRGAQALALIGSCAVLTLVARASASADELPAVASYELGRFTVYIATRPFRVSGHHDGKLLVAERARRAGSSLEFLESAGWATLGDVRAIRASEGRLLVEVSRPGADRSIEVRVSAGLSVEIPGALAVRDDLISAPDELFVASSGTPRLVLSSRGYAVRAGSSRAAATQAFEPDPDALRVESEGPALEYSLWPAMSPKEALRRHASLRARTPGPAAPPLPRVIGGWSDLRAAIDASLGASLAGEALAPIVPAPDLADAELDARIASVAALLPAAYSPPLQGASARLEAIREALEPLIAKHAALSREEGIAALRPLLVEHAGEREAWKARDQWMLGPDLIVAPGVKRGVKSRDVWIPPGEWLDARKSRESPPIRGPTRVKVELDASEIALYVRRDAAPSFAKLLDAIEAR
jgi:hypothetical protein